METHEQAYLGSSPSTCVIIMMGRVPAVQGWDAEASGMHPLAVVLLCDSMSLPDNSCHPKLVARTAQSSDPLISRCGDKLRDQEASWGCTLPQITGADASFTQ